MFFDFPRNVRRPEWTFHTVLDYKGGGIPHDTTVTSVRVVYLVHGPTRRHPVLPDRPRADDVAGDRDGAPPTGGHLTVEVPSRRVVPYDWDEGVEG